MVDQKKPRSIRNLRLTPGTTTKRSHHVCPEDEEHSVIYDAKAQWDVVAQRHFVTDPGSPLCDECGHTHAQDFHVENRFALMGLRKELRRKLRDLVTMTNGSVEPDAEWIREVCYICGTPGPLVDCYAEYDPVLDTYEITTTMDKGHQCEACDRDTRIETEVLSAHERLPVIEKVEAEIASLTSEIAEVDAWLLANGTTYGMTTQDLQDIASGL